MAQKTPQQLKNLLREEATNISKNLDGDYLELSDEGILEKVCALPALQSAQTVFCYVSTGTEPDTLELIRWCWEQGKRVCVPRCQAGGEMQACSIISLQQLAPAAFGLLEPAADAETVNPLHIAAAIVPCVMADKEGRRLGNGGGYYDRYLAETEDTTTICLCRGRLMQNRLPEESFDQKMDFVVTEEQVYENKK